VADPEQEAQFFKDLGARIKALREKAGLRQEDMISRDYSVRYWQKVEAGKPITLRTLLRICNLFSTPMHEVVRGLDRRRSVAGPSMGKAESRRRSRKATK
jgi:transcriptional regulator with XRE-family HTH domain